MQWFRPLTASGHCSGGCGNCSNRCRKFVSSPRQTERLEPPSHEGCASPTRWSITPGTATEPERNGRNKDESSSSPQRLTASFGGRPSRPRRLACRSGRERDRPGGSCCHQGGRGFSLVPGSYRLG